MYRFCSRLYNDDISLLFILNKLGPCVCVCVRVRTHPHAVLSHCTSEQITTEYRRQYCKAVWALWPASHGTHADSETPTVAAPWVEFQVDQSARPAPSPAASCSHCDGLAPRRRREELPVLLSLPGPLSGTHTLVAGILQRQPPARGGRATFFQGAVGWAHSPEQREDPQSGVG